MRLRTIVARNVRAARRARSHSQLMLANKARVSMSYISMLEREKRSPALSTLDAIAEALGVAATDFFGEAPSFGRRPAGGMQTASGRS